MSNPEKWARILVMFGLLVIAITIIIKYEVWKILL